MSEEFFDHLSRALARRTPRRSLLSAVVPTAAAPQRFDALARALAQPMSRRRALKIAAGGAATAFMPARNAWATTGPRRAGAKPCGNRFCAREDAVCCIIGGEPYCCDPGDHCCGTAPPVCCESDATCCGRYCCGPSQECCQTQCCLPGEECRDGQCAQKCDLKCLRKARDEFRFNMKHNEGCKKPLGGHEAGEGYGDELAAISCHLFEWLSYRSTAKNDCHCEPDDHRIPWGRRPARTASACESRVTTVGGRKAAVLCGPASATLRIGDRTLRFRNGECSYIRGIFGVHLGTFIPSSRHQRQPFFGIYAATSPGRTDKRGLVGIISGGRYYWLSDRVSVRKDLKGGSFSGRIAGKRVTGTFTC